MLRAGAAGEVPITVVRFGDVYGPGSEQWIVRPLRLLRRRLAVLPAMGRGVLTPTYVDDAVALETGFRAAGRRPPATRHAVNYLVHPGTYDIGKAAERLGWRPRVGFEEGMAASLAWAREVGLLDGPVQ